jgi:MoaA/NifB/PqqE/SkfB family radical SAM enzyme
VTTNGTPLDTHAAREHIVADYDEITFSLDGVGPFNDAVRGAPGLYERLGANIVALNELAARRGRGPRVRVNTILMRDNLHELEALCRSLAAWGVHELTFNTLGGRERPDFYPDHRLLPEHSAWLRQALPGLRQRAAQLGLRIRGSAAYLDRIEHTARGQPLPAGDCAPGRAFLFIDEAGTIGPCSFTTADYGLPMSEVKTANDLRTLPARFAARRQTQPLPACSDCCCTEVWGKFD